MKRSEPKSIGEILDSFINKAGISDTVAEQKLCYLFGEIVGPTFNQATIRRYVHNKTLYVVMSSAALKSELAFMVEPLIDKLNEAVGKPIINKIIIQ